MKLSKRAEDMPYSPIRKLAPFADEAKKKGVQVLHLNIGQPDIETPVEIFEAIAQYREKVLRYGPSGGLLDLRVAVVEYHRNAGFAIDIATDPLVLFQGPIAKGVGAIGQKAAAKIIPKIAKSTAGKKVAGMFIRDFGLKAKFPCPGGSF